MTLEKTELIISAEIPDWSRERKLFFEWNPSKSLLASIRRYQRVADAGGVIAYFLKKITVLQHRFWSIITGADIPINSNIGGGLLIPHPNGIVIHPNAIVGPNCLIFQQVTIGVKDKSSPPIIGGHVDIGAGAKIIGAVNIGNHAQIGANAVVLKDVPKDKIAIGVPAKII
jgi:serine O-acetyltransferase